MRRDVVVSDVRELKLNYMRDAQDKPAWRELTYVAHLMLLGLDSVLIIVSEQANVYSLYELLDPHYVRSENRQK